VVIPYTPEWPERFRVVAARLRQGLGRTPLRIDHIGSTAIPGLAAKPIIDIQVSVVSFEPFEPFEPIRCPLERLGYIWRAGNPDLTKRHVREPAGTPRTHTSTSAGTEAGASNSRSSSGTTCASVTIWPTATPP
jgi:GrpB-like predicted nucleotidyltransferase (UPF0157 family)